jgi:polyhydroxyalkanoate synthesis regulator phasin
MGKDKTFEWLRAQNNCYSKDIDKIIKSQQKEIDEQNEYIDSLEEAVAKLSYSRIPESLRAVQ